MTDRDAQNKPRVVIVGPCASGKSTLAAGLRERGFNAAVCSQEHSEIPTLWTRSEPDILIALDVDLRTIRARRGSEWPETIFLAQVDRLSTARATADLVIDATQANEHEVLSIAVDYLRGRAGLKRRERDTK